MDTEIAIVPAVWTSDRGTMAQETAKSRWPTLVQGMIDDVCITGAELHPSLALEEIKSIQGKLQRLREEIISDDKLR